MRSQPLRIAACLRRICRCWRRYLETFMAEFRGPNKIGRAHRCPASPLGAERQFGRVVHAPPWTPAAFAELGRHRRFRMKPRANQRAAFTLTELLCVIA